MAPQQFGSAVRSLPPPVWLSSTYFFFIYSLFFHDGVLVPFLPKPSTVISLLVCIKAACKFVKAMGHSHMCVISASKLPHYHDLKPRWGPEFMNFQILITWCPSCDWEEIFKPVIGIHLSSDLRKHQQTHRTGSWLNSQSECLFHLHVCFCCCSCRLALVLIKPVYFYMKVLLL